MKLRNRQVKNFLATTLISLGLPMGLMVDEVRRSQHGNNNAYCPDDASSWLDWSLLARHQDVHRFVKLLIAGRLQAAPQRQGMTLTDLIRQGIKGWHGTKLNQPDSSDPSHSIALSAVLPATSPIVYLIFNAYWEALDYELPWLGEGKEQSWRRWIDTSLDTPQDIVARAAAPAVRDTPIGRDRGPSL